MPVFDRDRDLSVGSARVVPPEARIIVAEGNYLLLRDDPWAGLAPLWDLPCSSTCPRKSLNAASSPAGTHHGLQPAEGRRRAFDNDIPNARTVIARSAPADITLTPGDLAFDPDHGAALRAARSCLRTIS